MKENHRTKFSKKALEFIRNDYKNTGAFRSMKDVDFYEVDNKIVTKEELNSIRYEE